MRKTNLIVESLEPLDPVHHWLQLDPLEVLIHPVNPLNSENVVAEVEALKPDILKKEKVDKDKVKVKVTSSVGPGGPS